MPLPSILTGDRANSRSRQKLSRRQPELSRRVLDPSTSPAPGRERHVEAIERDREASRAPSRTLSLRVNS